MLVSEKHVLHNSREKTFNAEYGGSRAHKNIKLSILNYTVTFQKHIILTEGSSQICLHTHLFLWRHNAIRP